MPSQQQTQLQEHQTSKIVDDDQRSKDQQQQQQQQQQQSPQQQLSRQQNKQQQQQNSNNININNNILNSSSNNNSNSGKFVMDKSLRKPSEKCSTSLLSASTQLLKEATVAALLQRNKQCASTISTTSCSDASNASFSSTSVAESVQDDMSDQCILTQAGLEEYNIRASSYYDQPALFHHQKQSSYAQSEGYHSYVSSSDSSSATPFLDRLRQESEMLSRQSSHHWSQNDLSSVSCASAAPSPSPTPTSLLLSTVNSLSNGDERGGDGLLGETDKNTATTISTALTVAGNGNHQHRQHQQQQQQQQQQPQHHNISINVNSNSNSNSNTNNTTSNNNSSESTSSTETLKWLGSMSDVSEASHATGYSAVSESVSNSQLIVHSSRVLTPKRHHSESVLYLSNEQQLSPHSNSTEENTTQQEFSSYQQHQQNSKQLTSKSSVNHRHSPSYPPIHSTLSLQPYHQHYYQQQKTTSITTSTTWETDEISTEIATSSLVINKLTAAATKTTTATAAAAAQSSTPTSTLLPYDFDNQPKAHKSTISVTLSNNDGKATITPPIINAKSPIDKLEWEANSAVNRERDRDCDREEATVATSLAHANRSNHRLFPVNTYTEHNNTSQFVQHPKPQFSAGLQKPTTPAPQQPTTASSSSASASSSSSSSSSSNSNSNSNAAGLQPNNISPQSLQQSQTTNNWHSVAELINDFERTNEQQPQKYAFMDPSKTQRISNPALKAFQKNAVQSYFERQQQQQNHAKEKTHNQQQLQQQQQQQQQYQHILRPHSFQATASMKEVNSYELLRSSLPNTYHRHQPLSPKQLQSQSQSQPHHHHHHQHQHTKEQQRQQLFNESRRLSSSLSGVQLPAVAQNELSYSTPSLADADENKRNFPQSSSSSSPEPPPPPPRSRSLMPISLLRRSSSASDYAEFREQYKRATQEKLQSQSIKNISSAEKSSFNDCGMPPAPPPRGRIAPPERRTSSASEYAAMRDKFLLQQAAARAHQQHHPHQYARQQSSNQLGMPPKPSFHYHMPMPPPPPPPLSASTQAHNPAETGWVPERPPKNPNLRVPSPDLPPPPTDIDGNLIGSDEPLPPPPPEILHRQPYYDYSANANSNANPHPHAHAHAHPKPSPPHTSQQSMAVLHGAETTTNRRNSFAGSSNRKVYHSTADAQSKVPPLIPKKPAHIELLPRPPNGGSFHQKKTTKAQPQMPPSPAFNQSFNQINQVPNQNRKRPHNPGIILNVPPIPENVVANATNLKRNDSSSAAVASPQPLLPARPAPPLPLKPRTSATGHGSSASHSAVSGVEFRCNSKASYLPRQSLEKLNNSDPDHGSYKLTLTSNEDLVNNSTNLAKPPPPPPALSNSYDILGVQNGKIPQNLPDVLPLGAKLQQPHPQPHPHPHPASPTGGKISPHRYAFGSNGSIASSQQLPSPMYPLLHRYSSPAMGSSSTYHPSNNVVHPIAAPNYLRSQSYDMHNDAMPSNKANRFMSQSTIDLKTTRIQMLDTTHEEECLPTNAEKPNHILSLAQSESNISTSASALQKQSSLHSSENINSENTHPPNTEGRIFRAELVSTTLPNSPSMGSGTSLNKAMITRRDSLRENIEKITQLQSQLMSAHLTDSGYSLSGYGVKSMGNSSSNTASLEKLTSLDSSCCTAANKKTSDESNKTTIEVLGNQSSQPQPQPESTECKNAITISLQTSASTASASASGPGPQNETETEPTKSYQENATSSENPNESEPARVPIEPPPPVESADEGGSLKLMQRSELILRVNPTMVEASCQTDELTEDDDELLRLALPQQLVKENQQTPRTTLQPRQRHPIEIDCDSMCKELATLLPSKDKFISIILPQGTKSASDYVDDLYNPNVPLRPTKHDVGTSTLMRMKLRDRGEAKNTVTVELQYSDIDINPLSSETATEGCDILKGKVNELMKQLKRKIRVLGTEQTTIEEESVINDELGSSLIKKFAEKVRPLEATKFRTYIDDIGHITSLLLSLSERLARLENSLAAMEENSTERKTLESKRDRLIEQLDEAKLLKGDIDRRGTGLTGMLEKNLNADDFADFDYFINMKAKLIADSRDISDKIKCGEEQLNALSEALLQSDC